MIAHALCLLRNRRYGGKVSPERVATLAMYHDATEVLTGDLPTPVKYFNDGIRDAYKAIESHAAQKMVQLLPEDLRADFDELLRPTDKDREAMGLVKAADTICAYIKCLEEEAAGNREFGGARKTIEAKLQAAMHRPEVADFVRECIPSFSLTLDEMNPPL